MGLGEGRQIAAVGRLMEGAVGNAGQLLKKTVVAQGVVEYVFHDTSNMAVGRDKESAPRHDWPGRSVWLGMV